MIMDKIVLKDDKKHKFHLESKSDGNLLNIPIKILLILRKDYLPKFHKLTEKISFIIYSSGIKITHPMDSQSVEIIQLQDYLKTLNCRKIFRGFSSELCNAFNNNKYVTKILQEMPEVTIIHISKLLKQCKEMEKEYSIDLQDFFKSNQNKDFAYFFGDIGHYDIFMDKLQKLSTKIQSNFLIPFYLMHQFSFTFYKRPYYPSKSIKCICSKFTGLSITLIYTQYKTNWGLSFLISSFGQSKKCEKAALMIESSKTLVKNIPINYSQFCYYNDVIAHDLSFGIQNMNAKISIKSLISIHNDNEKVKFPAIFDKTFTFAIINIEGYKYHVKELSRIIKDEISNIEIKIVVVPSLPFKIEKISPGVSNIACIESYIKHEIFNQYKFMAVSNFLDSHQNCIAFALIVKNNIYPNQMINEIVTLTHLAISDLTYININKKELIEKILIENSFNSIDHFSNYFNIKFFKKKNQSYDIISNKLNIELVIKLLKEEKDFLTEIIFIKYNRDHEEVFDYIKEYEEKYEMKIALPFTSLNKKVQIFCHKTLMKHYNEIANKINPEIKPLVIQYPLSLLYMIQYQYAYLYSLRLEYKIHFQVDLSSLPSIPLAKIKLAGKNIVNYNYGSIHHQPSDALVIFISPYYLDVETISKQIIELISPDSLNFLQKCLKKKSLPTGQIFPVEAGNLPAKCVFICSFPLPFEQDYPKTPDQVRSLVNNSLQNILIHASSQNLQSIAFHFPCDGIYYPSDSEIVNTFITRVVEEFENHSKSDVPKTFTFCELDWGNSIKVLDMITKRFCLDLIKNTTLGSKTSNNMVASRPEYVWGWFADKIKYEIYLLALTQKLEENLMKGIKKFQMSVPILIEGLVPEKLSFDFEKMMVNNYLHEKGWKPLIRAAPFKWEIFHGLKSFSAFKNEISELIELSFQKYKLNNKGKISITFQKYNIDFENMVQINVITTYQRKILRKKYSNEYENIYKIIENSNEKDQQEIQIFPENIHKLGKEISLQVYGTKQKSEEFIVKLNNLLNVEKQKSIEEFPTSSVTYLNRGKLTEYANKLGLKLEFEEYMNYFSLSGPHQVRELFWKYKEKLEKEFKMNIYPKVWEFDCFERVKLYKVENDIEMSRINDLLHKSMPANVTIITMNRIQNEFLMEKFNSEYLRLSEFIDDIQIKSLFIGTENVDTSVLYDNYADGFDLIFNSNSLFHKDALIFAEDAGSADKLCFKMKNSIQRKIILANVIVGNSMPIESRNDISKNKLNDNQCSYVWKEYNTINYGVKWSSRAYPMYEIIYVYS